MKNGFIIPPKGHPLGKVDWFPCEKSPKLCVGNRVGALIAGFSKSDTPKATEDGALVLLGAAAKLRGVNADFWTKEGGSNICFAVVGFGDCCCSNLGIFASGASFCESFAGRL